MFDDFFVRALIAGLGIAIVTGPLGCFVIWRRLSYFGDTLSHSSLLGVALALSLSINISLSVFFISSIIAILLLSLQKNTKLPSDALLGILAHSSIAVGLVLVGFLSFIRFDIMGLLFGDILSVSVNDIFIVWFGGALILIVLYFIWKSLFAATVNYDIAASENMKPDRANFIFTLLLAGVIAISIKMIGVLLITGLLTRLGALAIVGTILVAIYHAVVTAGFNIYLLELLILYFGGAFCVLCYGGGDFALDRFLRKFRIKFNRPHLPFE